MNDGFQPGQPNAPYPSTPRVMVLARGMFFAIGGVWALLSAVTGMRSEGALGWLLPLLMLLNAAALVGVGIGIGRRSRLFFYLGLFLLGANILLTVTDQFGLIDLLTMLFDIALLILLVVSRAFYLKPR